MRNHIALRGSFLMTQGDHVVDTGPGEYVRWDGTIQHDAEVRNETEAAMVIVSLRRDL